MTDSCPLLFFEENHQKGAAWDLIILPRSARATAKSSQREKWLPRLPPIINPLLQILQMESGDGGAAGAVAVATSAKKKQEKRAPGGHETFKVSNNFGSARRRNPPHAVKFDGGVCEPEHAGETPSPHKGAQGKEASSLFRPNLLAAAKGGRDVEAKAVTKDDLDNVEAKLVAEDDLDDDKGASVGRPRRKTGAATGGHGTVVVTGRPKAGQDPDDLADWATKARSAKVPPKSGRGVPA